MFSENCGILTSFKNVAEPQVAKCLAILALSPVPTMHEHDAQHKRNLKMPLTETVFRFHPTHTVCNNLNHRARS
jgi:hypothetical protein